MLCCVVLLRLSRIRVVIHSVDAEVVDTYCVRVAVKSAENGNCSHPKQIL